LSNKISVGIIFGGASREREISFAGGRTVYDNLNKSLFDAVPLFVDSFGNFILLNWQYVYKGSIRDFYPPVHTLPESINDFQIYAESIGGLSIQQQKDLSIGLGTIIEPHQLKEHIDVAFLALHGPVGEDGTIQGLLEYLKIPYTGSGILASAIGIDKAIQKQMMVNAGFASPQFFVIEKEKWTTTNYQKIYEKAVAEIGFPLVVKAAKQGSSIGISILKEANYDAFIYAVNKSLFCKKINVKDWSHLSSSEKINELRIITDIREGLGLPLYYRHVAADSRIESQIVFHPEELLKLLETSEHDIILESTDVEQKVLIEGFVSGKEFSCIVVQNESQEQEAIALPPTEIVKGKEMFDYRSKYLPGLARKITPINIADHLLEKIRSECERLFTALHFDVYARIDGFITEDGTVFLNDPNTTSGMMPSSFFFHQAAEIGLNPSQFLTYIIKSSLKQRSKTASMSAIAHALLKKLEQHMHDEKINTHIKTRVAVMLGGFSSERHISVESGRNIYEKLSSSTKYSPIPVFVSGSSGNIKLHQLPINLLLKDNADDIREKIEHFSVHPMIGTIVKQCENITSTYSNTSSVKAPIELSFSSLNSVCDEVFIALHGRPGEDGEMQKELNKVNLPFNGSLAESSEITINKFNTNEILLKHGFHCAHHCIASKQEWKSDTEAFFKNIETLFQYPFIAKPVDDGCSSAVRKIKNRAELTAFSKLIFRDEMNLDAHCAETLNIKLNEEFPSKKEYLIESLISRENAKHFLEITIGLLTKYDAKGEISYEVFEASEALSEGEVLSLEEKFLAGQGQNITPARYSKDGVIQQKISNKVKIEIEKAARLLNIQGYCRIDAFVRIDEQNEPTVIFIEVNSLPGMTPATCIFHQTAIAGYTPYMFIDNILDFGKQRLERTHHN